MIAGSQYVTGYKNDEKVKLLSMISPRMSKYGKRLHDQLLKKYNKIWDKVSISIKRDFIANQCTIKHIKKLK